MKINQNSKLYKDFGFLGNMIALSLCFVVGSLPIFTMGASFCACSRIAIKLVNKKPTFIVPEFFEAYKENFKQATWTFLIFVLTLGMIVFNIYIMKDSGSKFFETYRIMMIIFLIFGVLLSCYTYPLLAYFENDLKQTFQNAFILMMKNYFASLRVLLVLVLAILITFYSTNVFLWSIGFYIFMGFGLLGYLIALPLSKVLEPYFPEEDSDWVDPYAKYESK